MEVSAASSSLPFDSAPQASNPDISNMDVDMDIDLGIEPEDSLPEAGSMTLDLSTNTSKQNGDSKEAILDFCPEKVHIRGLDHLTTEDVTAFALDHYPGQEPSKIEWIDDTSANIVYPTADSAEEALVHFCADSGSLTSDVSPDQLHEAKTLLSHPESRLEVRPARSTDVKKPRAHEASRFYLLNPDKDPREQRNRKYDNRYRRRGRDGTRYKRNRQEDDLPFDVNMYDDDEDSLARRRDHGRNDSRSSFASDDSRRIKRVRFGKGQSGDLFATHMDRYGGGDRLRDRSASPAVWDGDGRFGFGQDDAGRLEERRSPPPYRNRSIPNTNFKNDLFSSPARGRSNAVSMSPPNGIELFPHSSPMRNGNQGRELFPRSSSVASSHRRTDAFDYADETNDMYDETTGAKVALNDNGAHKGLKSRSLADRVTGGPLKRKAEDEGGRPSGELNIRGQASELNPGFSIKGAASVNPRVKELFPDKANSSKELFGGVDRRGAARKRAEDLFG